MRDHLRKENGTILVVAIMVLLALSGIALLVSRHLHEIRSAANHNMARMSCGRWRSERNDRVRLQQPTIV